MTCGFGFDTLWQDFGVEEKIDNSYAQLTSANSRIQTVRDAYLSLAEGHRRNVRKWHIPEAKRGVSQIPDELNQIGGRIKETADVAVAEQLMNRFEELFSMFKDDEETEEELCRHWALLERDIEEINRLSRAYVMEFSVKFDKMRGHLLERIECYRIERSRIAMDAEDELVKFMTKKFQEQRIAKLRALQERLRVKHEAIYSLKMVKLMEAKHEHEKKRNAVDMLRTELSNLRIQYYTQPLTWKKRVSALMDKVLEKQQEISMLEVELECLGRRLERKDSSFGRELEKLQVRKQKLLEEKASRLAKKRRLQRMGPLAARKVLQKEMASDDEDIHPC